MIGRIYATIREWFPFSRDGRQTLIYLMFSLSTGILTLIVWWAMRYFFAHQKWAEGAQLADKVAWALLMSVAGYACFVSVRSFKIGKDGVDIAGSPPNDGEGN